MKRNDQKPSRVARDEDALLVHSVFNTIQGEGPFAGERAIFIRLGGCNLQCPMCDTEYTQGTRPYSVKTLVLEVLELTFPIPNLIVLTGGEPFRQNIGPLCEELLAHGFRVQIETNGTLWRPVPDGVTIVCSPKTHFVNPTLFEHIDAFKYVATADSLDVDGLPRHALEHPTKGGLFRPPSSWKGTVYLQPVDEQDLFANERNQHAVVASCMKHGYRLCLQLHKIIGLA